MTVGRTPRERARRHGALMALLAGALLWSTPAAAQDAPADATTMTLAQAEHLAASLRQGMTTDEVQKLLGKPIQTSLTSDVHAAIRPSKGAMQWTYSWGGSSANGRLRIDFVAEDLESYRVDAWQWTHN